MASWTPDDSKILSVLLDDVVSTQEIIEIRQDYCRIFDCIRSAYMDHLVHVYFTGSKAEGLKLPGSDEDYMYDVDNLYRIKVIQSLGDNNDTSHYSIFYMSTENVYPCFALLQHVAQTPMNSHVYRLSQNMNGLRYLSSDLVAQEAVSWAKDTSTIKTVKRQGPSAEIWLGSGNYSISDCGIDTVFSIHCAFWPNECLEWLHRPRHFGWPTSQDISSIIDFGFHLVPVGHPQSATKLLQWRISFSVAERTLVWSFNHVQMQCYAVMKIILKEFIKVRCNPQNQVLCSYFIKTFLFWKYESTELEFWHEDKLRECIKFLLAEFSKCIQEGILMHYFIPRFNLLSIKLTREAQTELLQLFDIIMQSDISIMRECRTLRSIWSEFLRVRESRSYYYKTIRKSKELNLLRNDKLVMNNISHLHIHWKLIPQRNSSSNVIVQVSALSCKTPLQTLVLKRFLFQEHLTSLIGTCVQGNKDVYQLCRTAQNDKCSFDISTCKLLCASLLLKNGYFSSTLDIINQMLSNIPPFPMYEFNTIDSEVKQLYVDMFLDSDVTMAQRAKKAWMLDLHVTKDMTDVLPLAFQIELYFDADHLFVSPFTCAYYLQFLCYHRMHQYDNRDRALQQLIEVANNKKQWGAQWISLNIVGHCLLLVGNRGQARDKFKKSYFISQQNPTAHKYNSAGWVPTELLLNILMHTVNMEFFVWG